MKFLREKLKPRIYQEKIFATCTKDNSLVVLPTGLGKTIIAMMVSVFFMNKGKVMFLAPTKPLVEQHKRTFSQFFEYEENELVSVSGEIAPKEREKLYKEAKIIFATPQTIENDILTRRLSMADFSLVVFDECHRAVGNYAYTFIAKVYKKQRKDGRIVGLSASPGSDSEKIKEVCSNLYLNEVIYMDENNEEVKPYVKKKEIEKIELILPDELKKIKERLETVLKKRLVELKRRGLIFTSDINKVSKRLFLQLQSKLQTKLSENKSRELFDSISLNAEIIKILYALELLQTQGVKPLINYFQKMKKQLKVKANKRLFFDQDFRDAVLEAFNIEDKIEHPKFEKLKEIITKELDEKKKFIVFTQYRETGKRIVEYLSTIDGIKPVLFIGQAGKEGLSQKEQIRIIDEFDSGVHNVLVATSVAEEGLHIPSVDYAIFFEPVPSGLRMIQRRGRVGRTKIGKIAVMYTKECIDEKYMYVSKHKERNMKRALESIKNELKDRQKSLEEFK